MSLAQSVKKIIRTTVHLFNEEACYKIELELKEKIISAYWNLYISESTMQITGIEIVFPDDPEKGERIYFDEFMLTNGMKIPRIRHWHELKDDTYSGTDLIIKEIKE